MIKLFASLIVVVVSFVSLEATENKNIRNNPTDPSIQSIENVTDPGLLKEFSSIKFLINISDPSLKNSNKIQNQAIEELKKIGQVNFKLVSVQRLVEEKEVMKSPFLTYSIKQVQDFNGQSLPFFQVSLICEASSEIANNKQYGQTLLWGRECFLKESNHSMESVVSITLPVLLKQFQNSYFESNKKDAKLTFLVLKETPR